jgi:hypothetical protein
MVLALLAGMGLRSFHYFRDPSMWGDEASAMLNVLSKNYSELLGPLSHDTPSPVLFLWMERLAMECLGEGTLGLRVPAFLASVALLGLASAMYVRWIPLVGACVAVTLLTLSNRLVWHSVEAKPYATDILIALIVPALWCLTRRWRYEYRMVLQAVLAPIWMGLSYPAVFVMGGLLAASIPIRPLHRSQVLAYLTTVFVVGVSFLVVFWGPVRMQRNEAVDSCWTNYFPNWNEPLSVPIWIVKSWASLPDYSFRPIGMALFPLVVLGVVLMARRGRTRLVVAMAMPIALAFVASLLGKYPFGGARVLAFAAPAMSLFIGESVAWFWMQAKSRTSWPRFGLAWASVPTTAALILAIKSLIEPWPSPDSAGASAYVINQRAQNELVMGNHWEHEYYFRDLDPSFQVLQIPGKRLEKSAWVVIADVAPSVRQDLIKAFLADQPSGWRIVESKDFQHTTVIHVERADMADGGEEPRR